MYNQDMLLQTLKGFRDFLPLEARKRQYVISTLQKVFELYGFEPLETPALEYEEILTGKYGEEGDKLMYKFEDNGGRRVALRYDQTVPLARVVAQNQSTLPTPFKRYQIQNVWRAENTQKGRFREFLQCDIDTVGSNANTTDSEILAVIANSIQNLGFTNYKILVNERQTFLDLSTDAIISIDKLKKIGEEAVKSELAAKGYPLETLKQIVETPQSEVLKNIIKVANNMGVDTSAITYEPTLARGLDYYTGLIIEVEIEGYTVGSVGGGGRYDNLIGMFAGKQIPAVGFAFGFDRIIEAMDELQLFPPSLSVTQALVTVFSPDLQEKSIEVSSFLRSENINTELYLDVHTKMEKQLKYADQKRIPYVIIIGPEEAEKDILTLKNLTTREQKQMTREQLIQELQKPTS